ncbi:uncharacterized protein RCC_07544 [Ramularia collo-cygni]|uniref:Uncharacterized protein n=1 Tax=Ramularia collo-cygni TaxID=112498 RepID=A0A2D3VI65_9PEZI|nr:uncharacterized protein RCC_07544 [Ramularia collo-cygni]CZT21679.1 uncharacterized protein RCC_07544 [Ramularia collo-cygni]
MPKQEIEFTPTSSFAAVSTPSMVLGDGRCCGSSHEKLQSGVKSQLLGISHLTCVVEFQRNG